MEIKSLFATLPLKKIKLYLSIAGILLIAGLFINLQFVNRKLRNVTEERDRYYSNYYNEFSKNIEYTKQIWRYRELTGEKQAVIDSLAEALKIRPKEIIKVEYITVTEIDTIEKPVYTNQVQKNEWFVSDTGQCFLWEGIARLDTTKWDLGVIRETFSYQNITTHAYYKKRPHKFLFLRFGRWQYRHEVIPECGDSYIEEIEFLPK